MLGLSNNASQGLAFGGPSMFGGGSSSLFSSFGTTGFGGTAFGSTTGFGDGSGGGFGSTQANHGFGSNPFGPSPAFGSSGGFSGASSGFGAGAGYQFGSGTPDDGFGGSSNAGFAFDPSSQASMDEQFESHDMHQRRGKHFLCVSTVEFALT